MKPSLGRIVLFYREDDEPLPAIVTKVWSDTTVNLSVFGYQTGVAEFTSVTNMEGSNPRWDWPPRV